MANDLRPEDLFTQVNRRAMRNLAIDDNSLELSVRILFLTLSRIDGWGHARFKRGELARLLTTGDGQPHRNSILKAIKRGAAAGYFTGDSTPLCVRPATHLAYFPPGSRAKCDVHRAL